MSITQGAVYSSPSIQDPAGAVGFAGASSLWLQQDTYNLYIRDVTNTTWVLLGLTNTQNLGLMPKSGGAATGAFTGATGLVTTDGATPFASAPAVTGANMSSVATLNDLANLQSNIYSLVSTTVQQAMAALPTAGISANMAFGIGRTVLASFGGSSSSTTTFQLPLPIYSDGTTAAISDCANKYMAGVTGFSVGSSSVASGKNDLTLVETTPNSMNYTITQSNTTGTPADQVFAISWLVIAIKPGA